MCLAILCSLCRYRPYRLSEIKLGPLRLRDFVTTRELKSVWRTVIKIYSTYHAIVQLLNVTAQRNWKVAPTTRSISWPGRSNRPDQLQSCGDGSRIH